MKHVQNLHQNGMNKTLLDDTFKNLIYLFDGLETRYHQEKYFKNNFNLVVSSELMMFSLLTTKLFITKI